MSLPTAIGLPELESGRIVRVELATAMLPAFGFDVVPESESGVVEADVLVGQDDQPRGDQIREPQDGFQEKAMKKTLAVVVLLGFAATAGAQVIVHERSEKAAKEQQLQVLMEKTAGTAVHVSVETKPVIGAPYSAEAVRESVQVLADGNRIVRRSVSRVYRDGKGRTRREEVGPDGQVSSIAISDPANGTSFMFDPAVNVAHRTGVATFTSSAGETANVKTEKGVTVYYSPESKPHAELKAAQEAELKAKQHAEQTAAEHASQGARHGRSTVTVSSAGGDDLGGGGTRPGLRRPPTKEDLGEQVDRRREGEGHTDDHRDSRRRHRQRTAHHRHVGGVVLAGSQGAGDDEARRSAFR